MLRQFLVGGLISLINIAVHAVTTTLLIGSLRRMEHAFEAKPRIELTLIMILTVTILMLAHFLEVLVWAAFYSLADVTPANTSSVYFAFVNYTTLGYGDILPTERWRVIGPMTAMNGVLMFGWSTAVMFEVLRKSLVLLRIISTNE
jgi:hypothetical protein